MQERIKDSWKGGSYVSKMLVSLCRFYLTYLKYSMKMKQFGLIETLLFHFHRLFKSGKGGGEPPDLP